MTRFCATVNSEPLERIAYTIGCRKRALQTLFDFHILSGDDYVLREPLVFSPYHGRKYGEPVTLIPAQQGPIWFSKCMVQDEYKRMNVGKSTRFSSPSQGNGESPSPRDGERNGEDQGDGSPPPPSSPSKNTLLGMDTVSRDSDLARRAVFEGRSQNPKPESERNPNWKVPSLNDPQGLERFARDIGVNPRRFDSYLKLQAHLIEVEKEKNKAIRSARPNKETH